MVELFAVEIRTSRLPEMIRWYETYLQLKVVLRVAEDGYVLLAREGLRVALLARPEDMLPPPGRITLALESDDLELLGKTFLKQKTPINDVPSIETNDEGFHEMTLTDPDGNRVKFFRLPG
jgi:catechol 2,3-dioxygenase-like lactoylglutathione lyase family enzyme